MGAWRTAFKGPDLPFGPIHLRRHLMQNRPMATSSDHPKNPLPPKASARALDFSLEPLPVPEAIESDSDTAWGLWEHTLQAHENASVAPEPDNAYEETQPGDLTSDDGAAV